MPEKFVRTWEAAYRAYGQAFEIASFSSGGDPTVAQGVSLASRHVASAWRNLATVQDLPWWVLAALGSATEAFESQATLWAGRIEAGNTKGTR
ncbi:hypothetical protein [Saccharopolyspora phatthalungensis]|uniref:Uncharacterized protein n=1 Tax=Saccharopolyspora phatthalungensis TaxID=664693 RepID=A0A840Q3T0_9PSEU|nr:hypothetical protein [Saccharopolyspora phatthalungensis]MBB5154560.1 hypothetical protein [Saccharopolyspora phatthalungensis]